MVEEIRTLVAEVLHGSPAAQALIVALGTYVLEDPTTITAGLIVADGRMAYITAFFGLWLGIASGDAGLYVIGRALGPRAIAMGFITRDRVERVRHWFDRNIALAVLVARFIPGLRLPTYLGAGVFCAHPVYFLGLTLAVTLVWTTLLLTLTVKVGREIFPLLGQYKWPVAVGVLLTVLAAQWVFGRYARRIEDRPNEGDKTPVISYFEFWPPWLFYLPVGVYYTWLAVKHRSLTLPCIADPNIHLGGMIFESKNAILDRVPESVGTWFASHVAFTRQTGQKPSEAAAAAEATIARAGLAYPIVGKPDQGQRGAGVQKLADREAMIDYLAAFPGGCDIQFQALAPYPNEVGVLYYRYPDAERGAIFSVTRKLFPKVVGDGERTLKQLILDDPRAGQLPHLYLPRHEARLDRVLNDGEEFQLVFAASHARGAVFKDGSDLITDAFTDRFDEIARAIPELYFCRFDVRYESEEALRRGERFTIVEINGAGAEATHIWDARTRLRDAYRTLFQQFRILFEIGAQNRARGYRAPGPRQFLRDGLAYRRQAEHYPETH